MQLYATILYYLRNRERVDAYIKDWLEWGERMREEQARNPSLAILKLRRIRAERIAAERKTADYTTP